MSLLGQILQREIVNILADEMPTGYLVRAALDTETMERPVLVVSTRPQANPHPLVRAVDVELRLKVRADEVSGLAAGEVLNSAAAVLLENLEELADALADEGLDLRKWTPGDYDSELVDERGTEHFVTWQALIYAGGERVEPPPAEPVDPEEE
jgi:hypothetical protein